MKKRFSKQALIDYIARRQAELKHDMDEGASEYLMCYWRALEDLKKELL